MVSRIKLYFCYSILLLLLTGISNAHAQQSLDPETLEALMTTNVVKVRINFDNPVVVFDSITYLGEDSIAGKLRRKDEFRVFHYQDIHSITVQRGANFLVMSVLAFYPAVIAIQVIPFPDYATWARIILGGGGALLTSALITNAISRWKRYNFSKKPQKREEFWVDMLRYQDIYQEKGRKTFRRPWKSGS